MDTLAYVLALEEICKADAAHGTIMSVNNSLYCYGILQFRHRGAEAEIPATGGFGESDRRLFTDRADVRLGRRHHAQPGRAGWRPLHHQRAQILGHQRTGGRISGGLHHDRPGEEASSGITAFLIDTNQPGFVRGKKEPKLGIRASATSEIVFEDYRVPVENRLGEEGEGFKIAMTVLDAGRIGIAAQALGIAEAAYEASVAYATRARGLRSEDRRVPGHGLQAGRYEDPHRSQPPADLQRRPGKRSAPSRAASASRSKPPWPSCSHPRPPSS